MTAQRVEPMKLNNHETRIALLEQSVGHISETLRRLEQKMDDGFKDVNMKIHSFQEDSKQGYRDFETKFLHFDNKLTNLDNKITTQLYWVMGTIFTVGASLGGLMAHGFNWF
jgi:hypothetical protein